MYRKFKNNSKALFLTPFIESGRIAAGQQASLVTGLPDAPNITSYSGYLTVNKEFNSNMFFWYFPALNKDKRAPLLIWLNGGPGDSSLSGLFNRNGPLILDENGRPSIRQYTWAQEFSMIYIDNPVGAGFSFTQNDLGYARNDTDVSRDLYTALQQFFTLFPNERLNDFYITGESYAGKFVVALAYKIHTEGKASNINLKGIALGNGRIDMATQFTFGEQLFQMGLIDENQKNVFINQETKAKNFIKNKQYIDAYTIYQWVFPYFRQITANPWMPTLLDNYKVLIYTGNVDIIVSAPATENYIRTIQWSKAQQYSRAQRVIWKVDNQIAGYVRQVGGLVQAVVRNAGHFVTYDKPKAGLDLITRFVKNKPF
ncbi:probable serine carboxypeptidase CPVL [Oppia nitens]|uniref:probable serine carboxypeptidase CPVL n=1 Tax=Oppia nitens TaxID=1686743 RepID=UPI0023DC589D|nr:probable serine carboxypeptidase CPVL [Oppia nitens]